MLVVQLAQTAQEKEAVFRFRYDVYVHEMGRYRHVADHEAHRLADPEDEGSWIAYASEDGELVGSLRVTWGGAGFSDRQVHQYGLQPFLDELPAGVLAIGERTMVAPRCRGGDVLDRLGSVIEPLLESHHVGALFGACEPHLISHYCRYQRPYGGRNINSAEAGYLVPLVQLRPDASAMEALGGVAGAPPRCIQQIIAGHSTVRSPLLMDPAEYWRELEAVLAPLAPPIFQGLTDEELRRCLGHSTIIDCAEGDRVLKKGGVARSLFVVLRGLLEVNDDGHPVAVLLPGEVFGETAFLLEATRTVDVDALSDDTQILCLSERSLRSVMAEDPTSAAKLLGNLAKIVSRRLADREPVDLRFPAG